MTSFWRYNDIIITSCVRWVVVVAENSKSLDFNKNGVFLKNYNDNGYIIALFLVTDVMVIPNHHPNKDMHHCIKHIYNVTLMYIDRASGMNALEQFCFHPFHIAIFRDANFPQKAENTDTLNFRALHSDIYLNVSPEF